MVTDIFEIFNSSNKKSNIYYIIHIFKNSIFFLNRLKKLFCKLKIEELQDVLCVINKNGTGINYGMWGYNTADVGTSVVSLAYANGTTDYFECYGYQYNGSSAAKSLYNDANGQHSSWQAYWVRP